MARQAVETNDQAFVGRRAVIIGSSGGIGRALADELQVAGFAVDRLSRSGGPAELSIDVTNELSIAAAASALSAKAPYQIIIVASGLLQNENVRPEKTLSDLRSDTLLTYFAVNSVGPALVAKHFIPLLPTVGRSVFAVLSARVRSFNRQSFDLVAVTSKYRPFVSAIFRSFVCALAIRIDVSSTP